MEMASRETVEKREIVRIFDPDPFVLLPDQ